MTKGEDETTICSATLVWMGCAYRNRLRNLKEETMTLLTRLRVNFKLLEKEDCCGLPLIFAGYLDEAAEQAKKNLDKIGEVEQVITSCPACYRALNHFYPNFLHLDVPFRVVHLTQFLSGLLDKGVLKSSDMRPLKMKVMYHDPCELGRHSKIYEEPRRILKIIPGLNLYEPRFTREKAACCGGGGLLYAYFPTLSSLVAARKLVDEDRILQDLEGVVTACPQCIINLDRHGGKAKRRTLRFGT
jgi:heterodisulfide reductase subunit D